MGLILDKSVNLKTKKIRVKRPPMPLRSLMESYPGGIRALARDFPCPISTLYDWSRGKRKPRSEARKRLKELLGPIDPNFFLAKTESSALNSKVETSWPEQLGDGVKQILVLLENMTGYIRGLEKRLETIERGCMFAQEKDGLRELVKMVIEEKEKRSGNTKVSEE